MIQQILKATLLAGVFCVTPVCASAQVWEDLPDQNFALTPKTQQKTESSGSMSWARKVDTNTHGLTNILDKAPHEQLGRSDVTIDLPLPDGGVATFAIVNSPIMEPELARKFPNIQTFRVIDTDNSRNTGRVDFTSRGFRAIFKYNGNNVILEPIENQNGYYTFFENDYIALEHDHEYEGCGFHEKEHKHQTPIPSQNKGFESPQKMSLGGEFRTYRMAITTTAEYTQEIGGGTQEGGLAAVVTAVNRLNAIFETSLAIRFLLVANNDILVFTDPETDPFPDPTRFGVLDVVQDVLDSNIDSANYDVGHVFGNFGGGVVAALNIVCKDARKGTGVSGMQSVNDVRFFTTFAHEIGHMFGAPHSFNGSTGSCGAGQRSATGNTEPHSGTTIMSYSGLCGAENLLAGTARNEFFHNTSMTFINDFVVDPIRGGSCNGLLATGNSGPVIDAGVDSTIPMMTPFILTGTASDADGDALTHIWEQVDSGTPNADAEDFADEGTRALFRSFEPSESLSRTFPQLERILAGDRVLGEVLPSTDRDMTFRMTTRDGVGGVEDDERIISVTTSAGPFIINNPASMSLEAGVAHTLTWDVANTSEAPVNCGSVSLVLSTDGGNTFPHTLAESTPNDGTETVTFPNETTDTGRVRANCLNQPFFAINDSNFTMTPMVIVNGAPTASADSISVVEDSRRVRINVMENDSDPEGDTLTLVSVTQPDQGGETEISDTSVLYTPLVGYVGEETFTYTINDGNSNTDSATVTVTVTEKPNSAPVLQDAELTVEEDSLPITIDVIATASDADGDTLTLEAIGTPNAGGTATIDNNQISYAPAMGYSGVEGFTYTVNDGEGGMTTANVTVTITPKPNTPPAAEGITITVEQDSSETLINALASANDADGDTLTLSAIGEPTNGGRAILQNGQISYTPATGFSGTERFTYTVNDGEGGDATASVEVTVRISLQQVATAQLNRSAGGGGGAFGPLLLVLLAVRNAVTRRRKRQAELSEMT